MGVAVRNDKARWTVTGNQIGALLAESRISALKKSGVLPKKGTKSAALIKTFVSPRSSRTPSAPRTPSRSSTRSPASSGSATSARRLRGRAKAKMMSELAIALDYDATDAAPAPSCSSSTARSTSSAARKATATSRPTRARQGRQLRLPRLLRAAANAKKAGKSIASYLDGLYLKYGYYTEAVGNIYYEGAAGAAKIAKILASYRKSPPKAFGKLKVTKFRDFGREKIKDADGKPIPAQDLYIVELANGFNYAVRGSGTEPKIKFYLFGKASEERQRRCPRRRLRPRPPSRSSASRSRPTTASALSAEVYRLWRRSRDRRHKAQHGANSHRSWTTQSFSSPGVRLPPAGG
jgi:phosphoglucomutase